MAKNHTVPPELRFWSIAQFAERIGKDQRFVRAEISEGRLKPQRIGVSLRIQETEVQRWLAEHCEYTGPDPRRQRKEARTRDLQARHLEVKQVSP